MKVKSYYFNRLLHFCNEKGLIAQPLIIWRFREAVESNIYDANNVNFTSTLRFLASAGEIFGKG